MSVPIAVISACHKRPMITRLFCMGMDRLRKKTGINFPVVVTGDYNEAFDEYDIEFFHQKNEPVSEKFNTSLGIALQYEPEHIMVMGSDDLMPTYVFKNLLEQKEGIDYLGFNWVYYYSLEKATLGQVKEQYSSVIIGAGRTFSTELLFKCKQYLNLWSKPMNRSLDMLMFSKLQPHIKTVKALPEFIIDVKSEGNLNHFDLWKGLKSDTPEGWIFQQLGKEEVEYIKEIKNLICNCDEKEI